ncbi:hypothetical protein [Brevibacillus sp. IT-7CA2]
MKQVGKGFVEYNGQKAMVIREIYLNGECRLSFYIGGERVYRSFPY